MRLVGGDETFDLPALMPLVWTGVPLVAEPSMTETVPVVPDETWSRWKRFRFWLEGKIIAAHAHSAGESTLDWIPWKTLPRYQEVPEDAVLLMQRFPSQSYTIIAHPAVIDRITKLADQRPDGKCVHFFDGKRID